jgi:hypothetical protein
MRVIEKIRNMIAPKKKCKVLIKSKFGLPTVRICGTVLTDSGQTNQGGPGALGGGMGQSAAAFAGSAFAPKGVIGDKIEDIYLGYNEEAKGLIINLNGIVTISLGTANEQYESIRVSYNAFLDLNALIKIYSFTSGNKIIFAQDHKQKKEYSNILKSINVSSVSVLDLVYFE